MSELEATGPNAEQITHWNQRVGPIWARHRRPVNEMIGPHGEGALARAALSPGERVLDVGCGCGETTLTIAGRVGAGGRALGVDISAPMLEEARREAAARGVANADFLLADAQTAALPESDFDVLFSRFGVMFFGDPAAAFANLARALAPGGRLAFVCWQGIQHNPWMLEPLMAAAKVVSLPPPPPPDAPGPFAFADAARVTRILESAGFEAVAIEPVYERVRLAGGLDAAVEFLLEIGPTASALREAPDVPREDVARAIREAISRHGTGDPIEIPSAAWQVTARRP
jgi:SAM-dependent methyltransferase